MSGKSIFILILTIGWFLLCQRWYCCWMQTACPDCSDEPINIYAVGFLPNSEDPDTTFLWSELVKELQENKLNHNTLEVSGKYLPEHNSLEKGLQRAKNVAALLQKSFPNDSIICRSQSIYLDKQTHVGFLPLLDIQWITTEIPKPQNIVLYYKDKAKVPTTSLREERRISELVAYAVKMKKKIKIDGHSSPTGRESINVELSNKRAIVMRTILEGKGIPLGQIIVEGHGSSKPIYTDNLEKNKRVELSILN